MTDLRLSVHALLAGKAVPFRGKECSGFAKQALNGPVSIGPLGLEGDEQADQVHHGGPDKAVHLYPFDHYGWWRERLGSHALLNASGAFGENITTSGGVEGDICLGDRFRIGSAVLEVSHGRQPCWKIDHRFGRKGLTAAIVQTGRCGVYLRVLQPGQAQAGDPMTLIDRALPHWSIARLFALLIRDKATVADGDALSELAEMPVLAAAWRVLAAAKLSAL